MNVNSLVRLVVFALATVPASRASGVTKVKFESIFEDKSCQNYLTHPTTVTPATLVKAQEYLRWLTGTHPALRRAFAVADGPHPRSVRLRLVQVPLGFAVPPVHEPSRPRQIPADTAFRNAVAYYPDHRMRFWMKKSSTKRRLSSLEQLAVMIRSQWNHDLPPRAKSDCAAYVLNSSLNVLKELSNADHWWWSTGNAYPMFKYDVLFHDPTMIARRLTLEWNRSFSVEDLEVLEQLRKSMDDDDVRGVVFQYVVKFLDQIITHHANICFQLGGLELESQLISVVSHDEGPSFMRSDLTWPPPDLRSAPEPSPVLAAPVIAPHEPDEPVAEVSPFDETEVTEFLATARTPGAQGLHEIDAPGMWRDVQRVAHLSNDVLRQARLDDAASAPWRAWLLRFGAGSPEELAHLGADASEESRRTSARLDRLNAGLAALAKLTSWVSDQRLDLARLESTEDELRALVPHHQRALTEVLTYLTVLTSSLELSTRALETRRDVTFQRSRNLAGLAILIGNIWSATEGSRGEAVLALHRSLEGLAQPAPSGLP